jgi:ABC-2 type transport system ATP-binding protein
MYAHPFITTQGLTRHFGQTRAVDDLTFDIYAGEVFGFLGHNGAGKTTTVRLLNGILTPDRGMAKVLGKSPRRDGPALCR